MEFSRQEYWSGLSFPSPENLPNPGIEPGSPALQADALSSEPPGKLSAIFNWEKVKVQMLVTSVLSHSLWLPWTVAHHVPLYVEFSRQEHWSWWLFSSLAIFLTQELNPSLLHCRQILYLLSHQGEGYVLFIVIICLYITVASQTDWSTLWSHNC